jgi:cell division protein FtsL
VDAGRAWKLGTVRRALLAGVVLSAFSVAFFAWNARHQRLEQQQAAEVKVAQATKKAASEVAVVARRKKEAESSARVQQLYDEINNLTRVNERVLRPGQKPRVAPVLTNVND